MGDPFKVCHSCRAAWTDRDAFLADPAIEPAGYQFHFEDREAGLFLFNHLACGNTLSLPAAAFADLWEGDLFRRRVAGRDVERPRTCRRGDSGEPCPAECDCAYAAEIAARLAAWPKGPARARRGLPPGDAVDTARRDR